MAVLNYTYLKLKILGSKGVITVGPSYEHAYECEIECVEHGRSRLGFGNPGCRPRRFGQRDP
jgi:hypothetical protein